MSAEHHPQCQLSSSPIKRRLFRDPGLDSATNTSNFGASFKAPAQIPDSYTPTELESCSDERDANLVSSLLPNGNHAPVIDIDLPCRLVASKTPGHFHLYIDKEMTWGQYSNLLDALKYAGVVEPNYVTVSKKRRMTNVRLRPEERPDRF